MAMAIMGAGSTGTIMGAIFSSKNVDVTLIDAHREHVNMLQKKGATVTGAIELNNIPVKAITPDEMSGSFKIVFYLVKQPLNKIALPQLLPHFKPGQRCLHLAKRDPGRRGSFLRGPGSHCGRNRGLGRHLAETGSIDAYHRGEQDAIWHRRTGRNG